VATAAAAAPHLHQIIEDAQAIRVLALLHLQHRAKLGGVEADVLTIHLNLQLLLANTVWQRPVIVILLHNLRHSGSGTHRQSAPWPLHEVQSSAQLCRTLSARASASSMIRFNSSRTACDT
jgi:hypothetical protein